MLPIESPFKVYTGLDGLPLNNGYVYIGTANANPITSPVTVYWDAAGTQPAAQPLRTINGYIVRAGTPANVFIDGNYSELVRDSSGRQIFYARTSADFSLASAIRTFIDQLASGVGSSLIGFLQLGTGAVVRTIQSIFQEKVRLTDFGAIEGALDNTDAFLKAKAYCINNLPIKLIIPKGRWRYTEIGNWAYTGLTIQGDGMKTTILQCMNTSSEHTALNLNAFESGSPTDQFVNNCNLLDFTVEGNSNTLRCIRAQGIARSHWSNIDVRTAKSGNGFGIELQGSSINEFNNLSCVNDPADPMPSIPSAGLRLTNGFRAGVDIGQCTNNVFTNNRMEYLPVGTLLTLADNNTFIGGTEESCTSYGLFILPTSRYNTFIGRAWENETGTADVLDGGLYNSYINCYSLKSIIFQGSNCHISGGIHERIEIQPGSVKTIVERLTINYRGNPGGGYFDFGTSSEWKNLLDFQTGLYVYPLKDRVAIAVDPSPFTWVNTTGQYVNVIMQSGTISTVSMSRNGSAYASPIVVPGNYLIAPTDSITFEYTVAPSLSYLPQNGFQG